MAPACAAPPAALYGYEAMRTVLDAIRRAGRDGSDRTAVIGAYLGSRQDGTVLGSYGVGTDGDVSGVPIGGFQVRAGEPRLEQLLTGSGKGRRKATLVLTRIGEDRVAIVVEPVPAV